MTWDETEKIVQEYLKLSSETGETFLGGKPRYVLETRNVRKGCREGRIRREISYPVGDRYDWREADGDVRPMPRGKKIVRRILTERIFSGILYDMNGKTICLSIVIFLQGILIVLCFLGMSGKLDDIYRWARRKMNPEWEKKVEDVIFRYAKYRGRNLGDRMSFGNPRIFSGDLCVDVIEKVFGEDVVVGEKTLFTSDYLNDERLAKLKILRDILKEENIKTPEELELFLEGGGW